MDLLPLAPEPAIRPGRRFAAAVTEVRIADGADFTTRLVDALVLALDGIEGDGHHGFTRRSGGREPWYPRGTVMRSGRQISVVSQEELAVVAERLGLPAVDPGALGANLVMSGVPRLSYLPAGTRLTFEAGATVVVEATNAPCRFAGRALAGRHPGRDDLELAFVEAARRHRGLVASVERAGVVAPGPVRVSVPEQWLWEG